MMQTQGWTYTPQYRFVLVKRDPSRSAGIAAWLFKTMVRCQAILMTDGSVGQMDILFADPGQQIRGALSAFDPSHADAGTPTPHAMNVVQLWLCNRDGVWGIAWTGFVDDVHFLADPTQGYMVQLLATTGYKLFEIGHVSPSDAVNLAVAFAQNVAASSIVRLAADRVGFPAGKLLIDPGADAGSGYQQSLIQTAATSPDEQTWSAVLQALMQNAGVEFFADEKSNLIWRRVGFLQNVYPRPAGYIPRSVRVADVLHLDLAESDRGVVTEIEVRWGTQGFLQTAAVWSAPASMQQQLTKRRIAIYANWIVQGGYQSAWNLAQVLGKQYSAGILQGTITLPADPLYGVGTLARVPLLYLGNPSVAADYYIASVSYLLEWGAQWVMTLGLRYGRATDQSFPYVGTEVAYPRAATTSGTTHLSVAQLSRLTFDPSAPSTATQSFTVQSDTSLAAGEVRADVALLPVGTVIQVDKADGITSLGPSGNGEYRVIAGGLSGLVLAMRGTVAQNAQVTIISVGMADTATSSSADPGAISGTSSPDLTQNGTGNAISGKSNVTTIAPAAPPGPGDGALALRAMAAAVAQQGPYYRSGAYGNVVDGNGHMLWDCAGLVYWAYTAVGYKNYKHQDFYDSGPNGLFHYFLAHGAREIFVSDAQPGDLLFSQGPASNGDYTSSQEGFGHVGWLYSVGPPAISYGALNPSPGWGLTFLRVDWFHDEARAQNPLNRALSMRGVSLTV